MGALEQLHVVCRRHSLRLHLCLLDATGHRVRREPIHPDGSLALRVLVGEGEVAVGRCQSDPGREPLDELAAGCLELLRRKGVAC